MSIEAAGSVSTFNGRTRARPGPSMRTASILHSKSCTFVPIGWPPGDARMRNALKWVAIVLGSLILIVALVAAYLIATFDPNDYKQRIVDAVQEKTGRKLALKGDIKVSFFPTLGVRLGEVSLSERHRDTQFASIEEAFVAVKLLPLIANQFIVDVVEVKGVKARIEKNKAGAFNFDDLKGEQKKEKEEKPADFNVDIDHVTVAGAEIVYSDHAAAAEYRISGLHLKTGRIAAGVTTPIELNGNFIAPKQKLQLDVALKTRLTIDPQRRIYKLDALDLSGKGDLPNISGLQAVAKGDLEARLAANEFVVSRFQFDLSGKQAAGDLKVRIDAPKLTLTKDKVDGGRIAFDATLSEAKNKLVVKASVPDVQGTFNAFKAGPINADVDMQDEGRATTAKLTGTLSGDLDAKRFEIPDLALNAKVSDPKLPKGTFDAALSGSARADMTKETAGIELSGKLDDSSVNAKAGVTAFSPLAFNFDVNADQLDVDKLLGKKADAKPAKADAKTAKAKDERIDLSALKGVNAAGALKIAKLTAMNLRSEHVRVDLKIANDRLDASPISAQLYQGTLKGSLSALAAENAVFTVKQALSGVSIGPLLRDAAQIDTLEGRGTVSVDLATQGSTLDALEKALNGTASVNLRDGSIKGMDIAAAIRSARANLDQLRGRPVQEASNMAQKTDFAELRATFNIRNGVAHNNDLSLKSPLLRVGGAGDIDIGNDRLDYVLKATVVATSKGQGGREAAALKGVTVPVKLTGALDAPQWSIDFAGLATGLATQTLQDEILKRAAPGKGESAPGTAQDSVKDRIKGLFGR